MTRPSNVFVGPDSLVNYLNPAEHTDTPLVELPENLNPFHGEGVRIHAKLMSATPLLNVKSVPAYNMLARANADGLLEGKSSLIENSSGNTVASLSVIGRVMANLDTSAYVSNEVSMGKLNMLRFFGVTPIVNKEPICPDPADKTSGIYKAKRRAEENEEWLNPGQYDNPANPTAHGNITGEQIWRQTEGRIGLFCAGLGTTGTMVGTSSRLKEKNADIATLGVIRAPNNSIPGPRTRNLLSQIAFDWEGITDATIEIGTVAAYTTSLELCRRGLLVGPSSGFALAGLLDYLKSEEGLQLRHSFKKDDRELECVFICCDIPFPYFDDYFEILKDDHFPEIENKELLLEKNEHEPVDEDLIVSLSPKSAWDAIYSIDINDAWKRLGRGETITMQEGWIVVDLRPAEEFAHFSLPGSINVPFAEFSVDALPKNAKDGNMLLVCPWGLKSLHACEILYDHKLKAYSLEGGLTAWSKDNYPRHRPNVCNLHHPTM